jgi:hypothetical protein
LHNFCIWLNEHLGRPRLAFTDRSYWIPGSYAPVLSEKRNSFSGLLKNG